jgi:Integrase core domain
MDVTHVSPKNGRTFEVLNVIDDHSRLCVASRAFPVITAADVVATFYDAAARHGLPASVLSDNGAVFTASFRGDRGALSTELAHLGIVFKHSRPYHPQTCGKVERFHQTMKQHLEANPARSPAQLQDRLDVFSAYYNDVRPHRATHRMTPRAGYDTRTKARPSGSPIRDVGEFRIRHDRVDATGKVTLRYAGKLRHLGIGGPTKDATCSCWSTTTTCASSPTKASSSPSSASTPTGPTSPQLACPPCPERHVHDVSRHRSCGRGGT